MRHVLAQELNRQPPSQPVESHWVTIFSGSPARAHKECVKPFYSVESFLTCSLLTSLKFDTFNQKSWLHCHHVTMCYMCWILFFFFREILPFQMEPVPGQSWSSYLGLGNAPDRTQLPAEHFPSFRKTTPFDSAPEVRFNRFNWSLSLLVAVQTVCVHER